jgi:hypothetical protein
MSNLEWTASVNGGEAVPCEFVAGTENGLKYIRVELHAALFEQVGNTVSIRIDGDGRSAEGQGLVSEVREGHTTVIGAGPLLMLGMRRV